MSNPNNVAGGLKATINNPDVSDETKANARTRLEEKDFTSAAERSEQSSDDVHHTRVMAGYKATLKNPNVGEEAKQHAKEILESDDA